MKNALKRPFMKCVKKTGIFGAKTLILALFGPFYGPPLRCPPPLGLIGLSKTRQSNHCGFSIHIFDNSKSKSMVRLVRAEKMVLPGLVFAKKIARMILIQNI